jgi:general secretion pathway protein D
MIAAFSLSHPAVIVDAVGASTDSRGTGIVAAPDPTALAPDAGAAPARTVTMDFQGVDIAVLAKFVSEITGRNFIVDDRVSGTITIIAPDRITPEEAYAVFQSVLQVKGFTTVPAGRATKIVPAKEAKETRLRTSAAPDAGAPPEEFITRLARVRHVDAATVAEMLAPLVSRDGLVRAHVPANMLVIVDTAANVDRLLAVVEHVDVARERADIEVLYLAHATAVAVAPTVNALLAHEGGARERPDASGPAVVADERTNSLVVRAAPARLEQIRTLVKQLDAAPTGDYARLNVYSLKYADAEALLEVLGGLLGGGTGVRAGTNRGAAIGTRGGTVRLPARVVGAPLPPPRGGDDAGSPAPGGPAADFIGDVRITADPATNALIVSAAAQDYTALATVLARLDVPRPQVYVEAIILEVSVERAESMGFDFRGTVDLGDGIGLGAVNLRDAAGSFAAPTRILSDPTRLSGLILAAASNATIALPDGTEIPAQTALFNAIAEEDDINILSAPNILTSDNEEAEIVVGQNVPFITSRATSETNLENLFATVERRDVGITLRITPQITEGDTVRLTIYEEVSALEPLDANLELITTIGPVTRVRSASTSVVVGDTQTVAIGGLLSETSQRIERKVPYLSAIPFLGQLLRHSDTVKVQTNLLIFLTPHILRTQPLLRAEAEERRDRFVADLPPGRLSRLQARQLVNVGHAAGDASSDWEVQAGATQDRPHADALVQQLAAHGYRAFILHGADAGDAWYRIRIGGLASRAEAQALVRELVARGIAGAFIPRQ